ncbi:MAG: flagellar basal body rod protein FlgB [Thiobacillaceae bacterium]
MSNSLDEMLSFNQQALSLRGFRQQLLASNIANADTPNYKARDIDFKGALQSALAQSSAGAASGTGLATTAPGHIGAAGTQGALDSAAVLYRTVDQGSVDGNTVDLDTEQARFADNAVHYEANLTMLTYQIKNMLAAMQD